MNYLNTILDDQTVEWSSVIGLKTGNRRKFIGSNLVIFCYKEIEKSALSLSEAIIIAFYEPIANGHAKISFFVMATHSERKHRESREQNQQN